MPNFANVLKDEISRLARKEIKAATALLRKDSIRLKKTVADHKRRLARLERDNRRLGAIADIQRREMVKPGSRELQQARITGKMVKSIRRKLGLSQAQFATLIGVNGQTVYQWEHKQGRLSFRGNAKAEIVEARKLTKLEAQARLAKTRPSRKRESRRKKTKKKTRLRQKTTAKKKRR